MPRMEFPFEETGLTYVFTQKRRKLMFTIISIMFIGIGIGYLMRNVQMLQKWRKAPRSPSYCYSLYSVYPSVPTV